MAQPSLLDINNSFAGDAPLPPATPPVVTKPPVPANANATPPSLLDINAQGAAGKLPPPAPDAPEASTYSVLKNVAAPFNSAIASVVGAPMDFGVAVNQDAIDAGQWLRRKLTGQSGKTLSNLVTGQEPQNPQVYVPDWIPTSQHVSKWFNDLGQPTADTTKPQNVPEQIGSAVGGNLASLAQLLAGGHALLDAGIEEASPIFGKAVRAFTESLGGGQVASKEAAASAGAVSRFGTAAGNVARAVQPLTTSAASFAGAGAGGATAEQLVPNEYKPYANMAGQLLGGGLTAAGSAAVSKAIELAPEAATRLFGPLTNKQQMRMAGQAIQGAATDKSMLGARMEEGAVPLVPGSKPTMGQATNDPGLMQLERSVATKNPGDYQAHTAQQNAARVEAMRGLAPETANPQAAKDFFKSQYDAIDQATAQAEADARQQLAQTQRQQTGNVNVAQWQAQDALGNVNGVGQPEQYGAALRNNLLEQEAQAKARSRALWQAIDPTGKASADISPFKIASYDIRSQMPKSAKPISGEELGIFNAVDALPQVAPFTELQALDSRIGSEIRNIRGTPGGDLQSLRRLQILKDSIRDTMGTFAETQGGHDAAAMQAGVMKPEDSIFSRLQGLDQEAANGATTAKAATGDVGAGGTPGSDIGGPNALRTGKITPVPGEAVPAAGVAGGPAGTAGVPSALPNPDINPSGTADPALAARYRAAKAATLDQKQRFNQGPVGPVLQSGPRGAPFATMDSGVGDRLFVPGPKGGETIAAFQRAGGDLNRLQDYITWNLRQAAVRNGELDPAAYDRWANKYGPALQALPPEITAPFYRAAEAARNVGEAQVTHDATIQTAQDFLDQQSANRMTAIKEANNSELKAWLKDQDPQKAIAQTIGDQGAFKALVARAKSAPSPNILESLRQNTMDYILGKAQGAQIGVGTDEALLKGDTLRKLVDANRGSLSALYTPEQMKVLDNVVADIQRQNQVAGASKLPFGSNTPQDLANKTKYGNEATTLDHLVNEVVGTAVGAAAAGPAGAVGGGMLARFAGRIGGSGLKKVDALIARAVLDPEFGQVLLKAVGPKGPPPIVMNRLNARLAAVLSNATAQNMNRSTKP